MTRSIQSIFATLAILVAPAGAPAAEDLTCELCRDDSAAIVRLSVADLMARAAQMAARNLDTIARIDGDLEAGAFGPPATSQARQRANLVARLSLQNWYSFLFPLAIDSAHVYIIGREAIAAVGARYAEPGVFPTAHLVELRVGRGGACARYDLAEDDEGWTIMGGRAHRFRVRSRRIDGVQRRVMELEWVSAAAGKARVLVAENYCFKTELVEGHGDAPRVFLVYDLRGSWVKKAGLHRPGGFAFWTTSPGPRGPAPAGHAVGSVMYISALKLRLPLFLPDFDLNDVRELGLPLPFVEARRIDRGELPAWLVSVERKGQVVTWDGAGAVPAVVTARFPDR